MKQVLNYKYTNTGVLEIYPAHPMVKNWLFTEDTKDEALLANSMAMVAEKNGMSGNDLIHLFPAVLRMLKGKSQLSK